MNQTLFAKRNEYRVLEKSQRGFIPFGDLYYVKAPHNGYRGSTGGIWVFDSKKVLWFLKPDPIFPELTTANEMICSRIYSYFGYLVPETALIVHDKKRYAAVKFIKYIGYLDVFSKIKNRSFRRLRIFAAYLKDWDRIHENTNTLNVKGNRYALIDFGGCLGGRAMGNHKPGHIVSKQIGAFEAKATIEQIYRDFNIMMRGTGFPHPAFAAITPKDIDTAILMLTKLNNQKIKNAVRSAHYASPVNATYMYNALVTRRNIIIGGLKELYLTYTRR